MASNAPRSDELPFGDMAAQHPPRQVKPVLAGSAEAAPASLPQAKPTAPRRFAGFSFAQLAICALVLAAIIWGMWASARIIALEERRVVSVRLAAIVNDFVAAEARSGTPPGELETRTRTFMGALDAVLKKRAERGEVVLVGEAVIASSVPDVTGDVVSDLGKLVQIPAPAAMPPAMPGAAPQDTAPSAAELAQPGLSRSPVMQLPAPAGSAAAGAPFGQAVTSQAGEGTP